MEICKQQSRRFSIHIQIYLVQLPLTVHIIASVIRTAYWNLCNVTQYEKKRKKRPLFKMYTAIVCIYDLLGRLNHCLIGSIYYVMTHT
jgi:predicted nucleic acid-binding Zn ribbon protein